jgi:signal transduction histidine kinase
MNTDLPKFLFKKFIEPKSNNEDARRRELILNIILCGIILLVAFLEIQLARKVLEQGASHRGQSLLSFSLILLSLISLLYLSRRGYFIISSYVLIAIYSVSSTYGMYRWGFEIPQSLLAYATIIVASSILISTRFSLLITSALSGIMIAIAYGQTHNVIHAQLYWRQTNLEWHTAIGQAVVFFLIMAISWLSNRETEKSLIRARNSERALKAERDSLEIKIQERTKELKIVQAEKISELYRFAKFGKLSAGIFHDLINPLTAVNVSVGQLSKNVMEGNIDIKGIAETKEYLSKAIKAAGRMQDFILTVEKQIRTQEIANRFLQFSLNEEIEQTLELLSHKSRKNNVSLHFSASKEITTWGNAIKFHQIAANLISNAIDSYDKAPYSNPTNEKSVEIILTEKMGLITFEVRDCGCGILPEFMEKVFDPFFTTKEAKGIGLGLSTAKEAVEKEFAGTINVASNHPHGSIFRIQFKRITKDQSKQLNTEQKNTPSKNSSSSKEF